MAIIVNLTDATVAVGGEFGKALAFVKALPGRKYDGATKTNSAGIDLKAFGISARAHGLSFDVQSAAAPYSGAHVTRYGTRYSRAEWDARRECDAAESEAYSTFAPRFDALKAELTRRATELGLNLRIVAIIDAFEVADYEERGVVRFTSNERREAVYALESWYEKAWNALMSERDDMAAAATERINERYGIY